MVSFFGLKIGGEKKKKSSRDLQISAPQPQNPDDSNPDGNIFDFPGGANPSYEASVYSLSRQDSRQSTRSKTSMFRGLKVGPFASNKFGSSMIDLPTPPSLRHHASNPNLGHQWTTGSSASLNLAPPSFNPMARPSTSDGRNKTWVSPLDVHFTQDSSRTGFKGPLSPALTETPKSPLGQYELKLDLPNDVSSFADFVNFSETVEAPAPLRIKKPASTRLAMESQSEAQSPQKPPSPPQSIAERETLDNTVPEPTKVLTTDMRPSSRKNHRNVPSGLEELQNAISNFGPASLPSPSTTPRASEEKAPSASIPSRPASPTKKGNINPVIRNVSAKRDTLTINPQRRRSLQMKIEAAESGNVPSLSSTDQSKAPKDGRLLERPPPLTLNMGFRLSAADRNGPRSAPFLSTTTRSLTPTSTKSPLRLQVEVERNIDRSAHISEIESPTGSSVYDDDGDDDAGYRHPPSPESTSPVIPLTGPLASPRFPPSLQSPYSRSSSFASSRKDEAYSDTNLSPTTPPVPPRSLRRNPPTPDSSCWPLPSPITAPSERNAISSSSTDSRLRSESGSESMSTYESLEPPRIPIARSGAESPTFRSFSRPWAPATGDFAAPPLRRAETTGPITGLAAAGEFGGGLRPPPRSVTVKAPRTEIGTVKSATTRVGGSGSGTGFI
ncbi:hypothetical protein F4777DRAFT_585184 [Nemania sp. FL0916]|nr:hypothetical protein F4777DRAFT_585184 [Nemania sp. FL0916]